MNGTTGAALRVLVVERADGRCEYCGLSQSGQEATFHVDHVVPRHGGGATREDNLALACVGCSLRKGARERLVDPSTGASVAIFHPPNDEWDDHFHLVGYTIVGSTATGRATVDGLALNRPLIVAIREEQARLGRQPRSI